MYIFKAFKLVQLLAIYMDCVPIQVKSAVFETFRRILPQTSFTCTLEW